MARHWQIIALSGALCTACTGGDSHGPGGGTTATGATAGAGSAGSGEGSGSTSGGTGGVIPKPPRDPNTPNSLPPFAPAPKGTPDPNYPVVAGGQAAVPSKSTPLLSPLIADHMVLQRDNPAVFGWAAPGSVVIVTMQEPNLTASGVADSSGRWWARLPNLPAGGPYTLKVAGPTTQTVQDVLAGEVWLWAGGSNAALSLDDIVHTAAYDAVWKNQAASDTVTANNAALRVLKFSPTGADLPQALPAPGSWGPCDAQGASTMGAAAYIFAKQLQANLRVPVGVVQATVVDSYIRQWLSTEGLARVPGLQDSNDVIKSNIFNGMISPLAGLGLGGVAWYQGETDARWYDLPHYEALLRVLKGTWRQVLGSGTLPFVVVELAAYGSPQGIPAETPIPIPVPPRTPPLVEDRMSLRDAQRAAAADDPFAQIVVTADIGDPSTLLPPDKWDVASRWAAAVLGGIFQTSQEAQGPAVASASVQNGIVILAMSHTGNGLQVATKTGMAAPVPSQDALQGFALAGADGQWVWALANIQGTTVVVSSPAVTAPVAVRYGWGANPAGNLYNGAGLPASPFSRALQP